MFRIDEEYFEDEVRDGFYIPSIAKRAWAAELSILSEINRICEKYDINYFADWGTLIGAVRHGGFIPWDDDMDICMFRSDLNRFKEVAPKELPDGFCIHGFENNDYSWKFIINVVNTERMCFTPEYLKSHNNFPYIAAIDIFVIDNVYDDEEKEEERRNIVKFVLNVADVLSEENISSRDIESLITEVERRCSIKIKRNESYLETKRQLYSLVQDIISEVRDDTSKYVVQEIPWGIDRKIKHLRTLYEGAVNIPFENTYIRIPKLYDKLLRMKYGGFWEIRMGVGGHGYPYFKSQKEELGLSEDEDYIPQYKFNKSLIERENGAAFIGGLKRRRSIIESINQYKSSDNYQGEFDRETVVFLPFNGKYWNKMKPFYEEEVSKENVDVFVIPLPYYYKEYNGTFKEDINYNLSEYPEELPVYLYDQISLEELFADRIYIQNPYDEYNMCMSVPKEYYSSAIRNLTKKLIYVPWFNTKDFKADNYPQTYNMKYYCTMPGVVYSDEIILDSSVIKERYIDKLTEFAGDDTREIWERKITVRETSFCPDEGSDLREDVKKTIVFYTSPSVILEHGKKYIKKIESCLNLFAQNKDKINVIWHMGSDEIEMLHRFDSSLSEQITDLQKRCRINTAENNASITVDSNTGRFELSKIADAYYGDPSVILKEFMMLNKPVMVADINVEVL